MQRILSIGWHCVHNVELVIVGIVMIKKLEEFVKYVEKSSSHEWNTVQVVALLLEYVLF